MRLSTDNTLSRVEIEGLIPHKGKMCLIDKVMDWDNQSIHCRTDSHNKFDNPLRFHNQLSSLHLIEYSAQAIALHGGLLATKHARRLQNGYLAAVRNATFAMDRLDQCSSILTVKVVFITGLENGVVYRATVYNDLESVIFSAEISVFMQAP